MVLNKWLPYARHYNPRFVYFLPTFWSPKTFFQGAFFLKFWPYVWLVFKSGFKSSGARTVINYKAYVNRFSLMNPFNNDRRGSVWVRDLKQVWLSCGAPMAFEWWFLGSNWRVWQTCNTIGRNPFWRSIHTSTWTGVVSKYQWWIWVRPTLSKTMLIVQG